MKKIQYGLIIIFVSLFYSSCGKNQSNSTSKSNNSDPCEDMRSYNKGIEYGINDIRGSRVTGEKGTCDGVLQYYNDNYNKQCFCKGFYKGQSQG